MERGFGEPRGATVGRVQERGGEPARAGEWALEFECAEMAEELRWDTVWKVHQGSVQAPIGPTGAREQGAPVPHRGQEPLHSMHPLGPAADAPWLEEVLLERGEGARGRAVSHHVGNEVGLFVESRLARESRDAAPDGENGALHPVGVRVDAAEATVARCEKVSLQDRFGEGRYASSTSGANRLQHVSCGLVRVAQVEGNRTSRLGTGPKGGTVFTRRVDDEGERLQPDHHGFDELVLDAQLRAAGDEVIAKQADVCASGGGGRQSFRAEPSRPAGRSLVVGTVMPVQMRREGRLAVLTLDREAKRNAIDEEMTGAIDAALNEFEDDPDLRVGVLTGGLTVFSAGTDLSRGSGPPTQRGGEYGIIRRKRTKPLIAAVEGIAFGGGLEIAMCCDMVVASREARFGLPEVKRGVVATSGGLFRAPRSLPLNVARELLLTGQEMSVERAERLGFVNRVVEPGLALEGALELAKRVAENSPVSVRETLQAVEALVAADDGAGWAATEKAMEVVQVSEDAVEGIQAFFEKRTPDWPGR